MKKRLLTLAAIVAGMFTFSGCDPDSLTNVVDDIVNDLMGTMSLNVTNTTNPNNQQQRYFTGDSIVVSSMCNAMNGSVPSVLYVGTSSDLLTQVTNAEEEFTLTFPIVGINLKGDSAHIVGEHHLDFPLDSIEFLLNLNWQNLLTDSTGEIELFVIACDTASCYIGISGTITVDNFDSVGSTSRGSLQNVLCYYVDEAKVMQLEDTIEMFEAAAERAEVLQDSADWLEDRLNWIENRVNWINEQIEADPTLAEQYQDELDGYEAEVNGYEALRDQYQAEVDALQAMADRLERYQNEKFRSLFSTVTINGMFGSTRANMSKLIEKLAEE